MVQGGAASVDVPGGGTGGARVLDLDQLLRYAVEHGASDVHVKVGARPRLRIDGKLGEAPFDTVEPSDTERAAAIMPARRTEEFAATGEVAFMYGIAGLGRFRVSVFRQRGWIGIVLRRVVPGIPGFDVLGLPPAVATLADHQDGLVLVSGLAGSGKTATLAAMVDHVNVTRECHIVTIEDPIEVLHADKRSIVDQREIGSDTPGAASALVHAMRQDPDVVLVGELTDAAVAWAALQAAEAGRLVLSSLPTVNAVDTVARVIELFEPDRQGQARRLLAATLRGVVSQRLLPRARGRGQVPATEILVVNARVADRILDAHRADELVEEMATGDLYGMQTFDQALIELYRSDIVTRTAATAHAEHATEMRFSLDQVDLDREHALGAVVIPEGARHEPGPTLPQRAPQSGQLARD